MMCEKCRAGQMFEYSRKITSDGKETVLYGMKCSLCGYVHLDNDDDIWSAVGL